LLWTIIDGNESIDRVLEMVFCVDDGNGDRLERIELLYGNPETTANPRCSWRTVRHVGGDERRS